MPPSDAPRAAAGFLRLRLREQAEIVRANEDGVRAGREEALHDLRVAMRRLRALLRAFRKPLAATGAASIERRLKRLLKTLGPARDQDVWLRYLRGRRLARDGRWKRFVTAQEREKDMYRRILRARLDRRAYRRLRRDLDRLLKVELRPGHPAAPAGAADELARDALREALRRIRRRGRRLPRLTPRQLHRLRIACRKARYLAEAFQGVLEGPLPELAARLQAVQDALGGLHDQDVYLERVRARRREAPADLSRDILRRRSLFAVRFDQAWSAYTNAAFHRHVIEPILVSDKGA